MNDALQMFKSLNPEFSLTPTFPDQIIVSKNETIDNLASSNLILNSDSNLRIGSCDSNLHLKIDANKSTNILKTHDLGGFRFIYLDVLSKVSFNWSVNATHDSEIYLFVNSHKSSVSDVKLHLVPNEFRISVYAILNIPRDAERSKSHLSVKALVNGSGKVTVLPAIRAMNDDIEVSHGFSTFLLDELGMFYIQSRGIDKNSANKLLLDGFLNFW